MLMRVVCVAVGIAAGFSAATGRLFRVVLVPVLVLGVFVRAVVVVLVLLRVTTAIVGRLGTIRPSAAAGTSAALRWRLGQKLLAAMLAAKVVRLAVALGVQRRRFVHRHSTNRIGLHLAFRYWLSKRSFASFTPANADPAILLH